MTHVSEQSPPVGGEAVNGHALEPFTVPRLGPVSAWTPPQHDTQADMTAPAMSATADRGDRLRRGSMWVLASGVAAIAAIVSYSHIYDLGRAHGGSGVAARLLPLSVDMLILVGELMLLHEADSKGRRFMLGWVLVWSGILATLAANVAYGAAYGVVGALIWGWPAYSFILAAGGMVAVVKRGASRDDDGTGSAEPVGDERQDLDEDTGDIDTDEESRDERQDLDTDDDTKKPPKPPRQRQDAPSASDKVNAVLRRSKRLRDLLASDSAADRKAAKEQLADKTGVSVRTVERALSEPTAKETS